MTNTSEDELRHLEALTLALQRRRRVLEIQRARLGELTPASTVLELEDIEHQLTQIQASLRRMRPGPTDAQSPYLGLLTFQEDDSTFFFGRDALVGELLGKAEQASFLVVLGPSGSGKSSVVRAGLIPALKRGALPGSEMWSYLAPLKPGARPLNALAATLAAAQASQLGDIATIHETLRNKPDALLLMADGLLNGQTSGRLVLVVDQAEELWTLAPIEPAARTTFLADQQQPFIQCLLAAAEAPDRPVLTILTLRADFLHRALEHQALAAWTKTHNVLVEPLTRDELHSAITRPAELVGAGFEPGLVDTLVEQTISRPGALPLLEYTLLELWKERQPDGTLTWEALKRIGGGVEGGLARRADTVLAKQYTPEQQAELRAVLLRLVQPGEGTADTRRRVPLEDLVPAGSSTEAVQALLKPLADERLITTGYNPESNEETVEVSHEALIRAWPTLGGWIATARGDLRLHIQLGEAAKDWMASGENPDLLWSGLRLANAEAWLDRARPRLNVRDQQFLDASRAYQRAESEAEQARLAAEEAARQRELEQARALAAGAIRLRRRAIYLGVALAATVAVAALAGWFWYSAGLQEQRAFAQLLVAKGQTVYEDHPLLGVRLVIEGLAWLPQDDPARTDVISLTAQLSQQGRLRKIAEDGIRIYPSADDTIFILTHEDTDTPAELWHTASITAAVTLAGDVDEAWFSPDSSRVFVNYTDKPDELRRADGSAVPLAGDLENVLFSSDSKRAIVGYADANQPDELRRADGSIVPLAGDLQYAWFSPDSTQVFVGYKNKPDELWRADGSVVPFADNISYVEFSPDSKLAIISYSGNRPGELRRADGTTVPLADPIDHIWFSPDSERFFVRYNGDATDELRRADGSTVPLPDINDVWFSPDSKLAFVAYREEPDELRRADGSTVTLDSPISGVDFSPDGTQIFVAYSNKPTELRRADGSIVSLTDEIRSVQFSPDGKLAIINYNVNKPDELRRADGSTITFANDVNRVMFSRDSKLAIVEYRNPKTEVWETQGAARPLAVFTNLSYFVYDTQAPYLITQDIYGAAYILDIPWLRAIANHVTPPSEAELIKQICALPLLSPSFEQNELQPYLDNRAPKACH